jgi:hypothetical protein
MEGGTDHDLRTIDVAVDNDEDVPKEKTNNDETNSKKSSENKVINGVIFKRYPEDLFDFM